MLHDAKSFLAMIDPASPKYRSSRIYVAHGQSWRITPRHAAGAAAVCWLGFAVTTALVLSGSSAPLDQAGLLFWRSGPLMMPRGPIWMLETVRDLTALGGVVLRYLFALAGFAALVFFRMRREAYVLAGTLLSGWLVESAVKLLVGRPRPLIVPQLTEAGGASFPSGHSFNAALVYIALALAFAALSPRPRLRWTLIAGAMVLSLGIALTRVWLGVHFPSDVIAGWCGGAAWAFTAAALLDRTATAAASRAGQELGV